MLNQQDQKSQSLVSAIWTKTAKFVEILFLVGVLLIVLHFVGLIALICFLRRLPSVPSWVWTELKVLVYPITPIIWFRLLTIATTYRLRLNQKKHYIYIFVYSLTALVLALNLSAWYSNAAFPLLSITYTVQWALDADLPPKPQRKQKAFSQHRPSNFFRRTQQIKHSTPARLPHKVGIWHHPADEKFAARLRAHLQAKTRQENIELWDASDIQPGALWQDERAQATQSVAVAVVLLSVDFIACDSIVCNELPQLLYRAKTQGTVILPIYTNPCDLAGSGLERFQALNSPEKSLAKLGRSDRDMALTQATRIICQRLGIRS